MTKQKGSQQQRKIEYKEFQLEKIKIKDYGVDFMWKELGLAGRHLYEFHAIPHEDLIDSLNDLKMLFAQRIGLFQATQKFKKVIESKKLENLQELNKIEAEEAKRVSISGLSIVHNDKMPRVIISGQLKIEQYGSVALNPSTSTNSDKLGYEEELVSLVEKVKKEAYNMLFLGKVGVSKDPKQKDLEDEIAEMEKEEKQKGNRKPKKSTATTKQERDKK